MHRLVDILVAIQLMEELHGTPLRFLLHLLPCKEFRLVVRTLGENPPHLLRERLLAVG